MILDTILIYERLFLVIKQWSWTFLGPGEGRQRKKKKVEFWFRWCFDWFDLVHA